MALAQTSTNFTLEEYTLNFGGTPSQSTELSSASFSITLASIGDTVAATGLGRLDWDGCAHTRSGRASNGKCRFSEK